MLRQDLAHFAYETEARLIAEAEGMSLPVYITEDVVRSARERFSSLVMRREGLRMGGDMSLIFDIDYFLRE